MLNKVFLIGNLGQDPEVRHTNSGQPVANLRVATSRRVKDRDGNWGEQTEWHSVVCFSRTAENAGQYLRKGSKVFIEGRIQTRSWEDKEGKKQYRTEIICENFQMLGSRGGAGYFEAAPGQSAGPSLEEPGYGGEPEDDYIPF